MKKLVYIAPHLSTGGMPQYLYKQIEMLINDFDIYCIEWSDVTGGVLVIQKDKIYNILNNKLITLKENKKELFNIINTLSPDIIHLQEIPELFMDHLIAEQLYSKNRKYSIIETSHDSSFNIENKIYFPDKFMMVSQYQIDSYKLLNIPCELVEYPIEHKIKTKTRDQALKILGLDPKLKHIINIGLFTPRKNQAEIIEYAKQLKDYPIQFHFIGNHADNFKYYWEPLMKDFPSNCKWWNERSDIDSFFEAADLFLFTSRGSNLDKETMPLVIREALGWNIPSLIYNLPVYLIYFDKYNNIEYLDFNNLDLNINKILNKIDLTTHINTDTLILNKRKVPLCDDHNGVNVLYGLKDLITENFPKNASIVEVGCFEGKSIELFSIFCKNVYVVDPYSSYNDISDELLLNAKSQLDEIIKQHPNIIKLKKHSIDVSLDFEDYSLDAVYIDGAHDYINVKNDILTWIKKIKPNGILCGHDRHSDGINTALKEIFNDSFIAEYSDTSWAIKVNTNYIQSNISSKWNLESQTIYFSSKIDINFPIRVVLKEYMSNAVMYGHVYNSIPKNIEFWMIPVDKNIHKYELDQNFSGVKLCIYNIETGDQIYEQPYYHRFTNVPQIESLSNVAFYYNNYLEYFVNKKYDKWFKGKYFKNVIDVGANIGVFTKFIIYNNISDNIFSIECSPTALNDLYYNFKNENRVTIIPKALHISNEPITFYNSEEHSIISSTIPPEKLTQHTAGIKGESKITVDTITLKELIDQYGTIDLLKIDIEGAEYNIFDSIDVNLFDNINNMFIECHYFEDDYKEKYLNLKNILICAGYIVHKFSTNQDLAGQSECIFVTRSTN